MTAFSGKADVLLSRGLFLLDWFLWNFLWLIYEIPLSCLTFLSFESSCPRWNFPDCGHLQKIHYASSLLSPSRSTSLLVAMIFWKDFCWLEDCSQLFLKWFVWWLCPYLLNEISLIFQKAEAVMMEVDSIGLHCHRNWHQFLTLVFHWLRSFTNQRSDTDLASFLIFPLLFYCKDWDRWLTSLLSWISKIPRRMILRIWDHHFLSQFLYFFLEELRFLWLSCPS